MFTAQYALIPYIKQTHFVVKGLIYHHFQGKGQCSIEKGIRTNTQHRAYICHSY
jgi:hypothetical protein